MMLYVPTFPLSLAISIALYRHGDDVGRYWFTAGAPMPIVNAAAIRYDISDAIFLLS